MTTSVQVSTGCVVSGAGDVRTDERNILYGGGVLRFVLPDQFNVGRGRPELRRRSGNHARGTQADGGWFLLTNDRNQISRETKSRGGIISGTRVYECTYDCRCCDFTKDERETYQKLTYGPRGRCRREEKKPYVA